MRGTVRPRRISKSANEFRLHQPASLSTPWRADQLAGLYPYNPSISDQHPCALSDYNNGATLIRTGMMRTHLCSGHRFQRAVLRVAHRVALVMQEVANGWYRNATWHFTRQIRAFAALFRHVPPSNLQIGEADGDAPV
jgi:hypothetical protein